MSNLKQTPVAVVGMAGILPGANDINSFWQNILNKVNSVHVVPENRWISEPAAMFHHSPLPDKAISKNCCLVQDFNFDPSGFALDPDLLMQLDPLYQMVLQAGAHSIRSITSLNRKNTGVILAAIALPTDSSSEISRKIVETTLEDRLFGNFKVNKIDRSDSLSSKVTGLPGAILARSLDLHGGSYTLDAACASSLYAVKLACDELLSYRADAMIAGGVSRPECLYTQVGFSQLRALSPSGICAPFDKTADGLVVGEGAGILVLKRYDDALKDGDQVFGLIKGIGLSNDMRGNILAPESEGQVRAMKKAYESAGLTPQDMDLIECHGAGTPVGDTTEIQSLIRLWGKNGWSKGQCAIGSVKSMTGHLLTAAGAAGMIKTFLALKYKTLPPSLGFKCAPDNSPMHNSPFYVQTESETWKKRNHNTPRRAAVSAFGFGGINAHLIIEDMEPESNTGTAIKHTVYPKTISAKKKLTRSKKPVPIAIIGMDAAFGSIRSLSQLKENIFNGKSIIQKRPEYRWKGCDRIAYHHLEHLDLPGGFMEDFGLNIKDFHIPPNELPDIIPQHLLMLKSASKAMQDANLPIRAERPNMGVIIGMNFDFEATNFHLRWNLNNLIDRWIKKYAINLDQNNVKIWLESLKNSYGPPLTPDRTLGALGGIIASRIAREFCFGGPSFTVSSDDTSGLKALEIGVKSLQKFETDAYLVGSVDLFGDVRSIVTAGKIKSFSKTGRVSPFDIKADGTLPGEGAASVVMKRLDQALEDGHRIYAVIKGTGNACYGGIDSPASSSDAYISSLDKSFRDANTSPSSIGYIETHGSGDPLEDDIETIGLHHYFGQQKDYTDDRKIAIGSIKSIIGHTGAASGLASLIKTCICIYHEIIPSHINYSTPLNPKWRKNIFHFPAFSQYWVRNRNEGPRSACVSSMTTDGNCSTVILEEFQHPFGKNISQSVQIERKRPMGMAAYGLFMVKEDSKEELLESLGKLNNHINDLESVQMESIAKGWYLNQPSDLGKKHCLSIVAKDVHHLKKHVQEAMDAINNERHVEMAGRGGVHYSPSLPYTTGKVAFVYPGSGNHYIGMGRDIGMYWPEIFRELDMETPRLKDQLLPHIYSPHSFSWEPGWENTAYQNLISDPLNMIFGQVVYGALMNKLLQKFQLKPSAVIGYSLGETTGMFAHGAWPDRNEMLKRMLESDLFSTQLSGPCYAARKSWNINEKEPFHWVVAVVNRSAHVIKKTITDFEQVRLLIVNTPEECVIGGDRNQINTVVKNLACEAYYLNGVVTVHCDAAKPVSKMYRDLHYFPTTQPKNIVFYSCAQATPHELTPESAAQSILSQAVSGFNFPDLIEQAYHDGVRYFLEIGPSSSCTRMIRQILDQKPHLAISASHKGEDCYLTILKLLGTVMAEGLPVDLDFLYGSHSFPLDQSGAASDNQDGQIRMLIGGKPITPSLPETDIKDIKKHMNSGPLKQNSGPNLPFNEIIQQIKKNTEYTAQTHQQFLDFSNDLTRSYERAFNLQSRLLQYQLKNPPQQLTKFDENRKVFSKPLYNRDMCLEFAIGSVSKVLGPEFSDIDKHKVRVRLPDEPLMLVDRIISIDGEKLSMKSGRIVTEHDVLPNAWYLDGGHVPVCISVEAGQADLFLCSYLGIDHLVKGERSYRLLDATVKFHRKLPVPGDIIRYEIEIERFVQQGDTYLFFFKFNGFIRNERLITMTNGCAGFFTEEEVKNSGGILQAETDTDTIKGNRDHNWRKLVPFSKEKYNDDDLNQLREGNLSECFGSVFKDIKLAKSLRLPGGRMKLIDRILSIDPEGGKYRLGIIRAEADIRRDEWFLTCHFMDDMVMPGTLMYECCAHTLRIYMQRLGWVTEKENTYYAPMLNVESILKCRGPVTPETKRVVYEVEIKEIGYSPEPYIIADAHMYADGHYIVWFKDMTMKISGITQKEIESIWIAHHSDIPDTKHVYFDKNNVLEFAKGKPSKAFGEPYEPFDHDRFIARLPVPPYSFIDRVIHIDPEPWVLEPGGWIEAEYDVNPEAWFFKAERSQYMPYCVLNEIALQACGWLAAYMGSALRSEKNLRFRNLGGKAIQHQTVPQKSSSLLTRTRLTQVSEAVDMIIEYYDFQVRCKQAIIYEGQTHFGFFTKKALSQQAGIRNAADAAFIPPENEISNQDSHILEDMHPFTPDDPIVDITKKLSLPSKALRMIDTVDVYLEDGGSNGLGYIRGSKKVNPDEWFFKAHFYQDPVCPGSLGLESFLQLIKYIAIQKWAGCIESHQFSPLIGIEHEWMYRGQILPASESIEIEADVIKIENMPKPTIFAKGYLKVDGIYIYKMDNFGLSLIPNN